MKRTVSGDTFFEQGDKIDDIYWEELRTIDPADVCRRSLAGYREQEKAYELKVLNDDLLIFPERKRIERISRPATENDAPPGFNAVLVSVHYLLRAREAPIAREYVAESQLTDGSFFFKGPHALPSWKIEQRFGQDGAGFIEKGKLIGGIPVDFGDVALEFLVLPRIQIAYVLWVGDEEFPPRSRILFDASADKHFALDVVWAMCNLVTNKLLAV
ncbi:MAG: DUF3786 domain-containing protein [Candidatus Abyssobacteria bacterium SURF_17]|uniref:DUF3786 domain-containing protein n=1 Tax=Candidatus Abyssobacteria bacterium SURF_17 TaxID=2093361 RepID=A0A419F2Z9_9BACT|nr:MAG: DUF3786 domain-containing protein [Candidatus Abyssubacteria bacterium SURF_17]